MPQSDYILDVPYTASFYPQLAPRRLALAALLGRRQRARPARRIYELGIGQGFGLALLAAANPDLSFEGCDFNADHIAQAQRFVDDAGLDNITVTYADFAGAAEQSAARDLDLVLAHGILSWVAADDQRAIVRLLARRLRDEGLFYVSYNASTAWAPLAPLRDLLLEVKRRTGGGSHARLSFAMHWLQALRGSNVPLFAANPALAGHFDAMLAMDPAYLAHEYLAEGARALSFAEVSALLEKAKLAYAGATTLMENFDTLAVPAATVPLLTQTDDPILQETLRDFAVNRFFRRDVFGRNLQTMSPEQQRGVLGQLRFTLTVPRARLNLAFHGPAGPLTGRSDLYGPLADRLAGQGATLDDLASLARFEGRFDRLLECLVLLIDSGQACPVSLAPRVDPAPARRFNRMIVDQARRGRVYGHLASPIAGTGIPVSDFDLLALAAIEDGVALDPLDLAQRGLSIIGVLGRRPARDGVAIENDAEAIDFLARPMQCVIEQDLPLWRQLGMV